MLVTVSGSELFAAIHSRSMTDGYVIEISRDWLVLIRSVHVSQRLDERYTLHTWGVEATLANRVLLYCRMRIEYSK
jgi:hypothetical protein